MTMNRTRAANIAIAAGGLFILLVLGGCAGSQARLDGSIAYTYSAFDFSGAAWKAQQKLCEAEGKKPQDLGTDCGFWTCTSRLGCR